MKLKSQSREPPFQPFITGKTCLYGYLGRSVCYEALPFVMDSKLARVDRELSNTVLVVVYFDISE